MVKTFQQFLRRRYGRADFADDDARRVIRKNRRFERRRARRNRQRERGDDRVARAGNVEHFLRDGRDVKRLLPALAEQHAQFAERDQQHRRAQFVEQSFRDEHEIFVGQRIRVARFVRQIRQFKSFLAVRRDERKAGQIQMMHRLGVEAQPDAARAAERFDFIEQRLRHDALAVIADNDGGGLREF